MNKKKHNYFKLSKLQNFDLLGGISRGKENLTKILKKKIRSEEEYENYIKNHIFKNFYNWIFDELDAVF